METAQPATDPHSRAEAGAHPPCASPASHPYSLRSRGAKPLAAAHAAPGAAHAGGAVAVIIDSAKPALTLDTILVVEAAPSACAKPGKALETTLVAPSRMALADGAEVPAFFARRSKPLPAEAPVVIELSPPMAAKEVPLEEVAEIFLSREQKLERKVDKAGNDLAKKFQQCEDVVAKMTAGRPANPFFDSKPLRPLIPREDSNPEDPREPWETPAFSRFPHVRQLSEWTWACAPCAAVPALQVVQVACWDDLQAMLPEEATEGLQLQKRERVRADTHVQAEVPPYDKQVEFLKSQGADDELIALLQSYKSSKEKDPHALWTEVYKPHGHVAVCARQSDVQVVYNFLRDWAARVARESSGRGGEDSDDDEDRRAMRLLVVAGPGAACKTSSVYACAESLGLEVLEMSASDRRSGREVLQSFGEAASTKQLSASAASPAPADAPPAKKRRRTKAVPVARRVFLFDDLDVNFEQDVGLYNAVISIAQDTCYPVIATCREVSREVSRVQDKAPGMIVRSRPAEVSRTSLYVQLCLVAEGKDVTAQADDLKLLSSLLRPEGIRAILNTLQFWTSAAPACRYTDMALGIADDLAGQSTMGKIMRDRDVCAIESLSEKLAQVGANYVHDNWPEMIGPLDKGSNRTRAALCTLADALSVADIWSARKSDGAEPRSRMPDQVCSFALKTAFDAFPQQQGTADRWHLRVARASPTECAVQGTRSVPVTFWPGMGTRPPAWALDNAAKATEIFPMVAGVCRGEQLRQDSRVKRRFTHYFGQEVAGLSQKLVADFCIAQAHDKSMETRCSYRAEWLRSTAEGVFSSASLAFGESLVGLYVVHALPGDYGALLAVSTAPALASALAAYASAAVRRALGLSCRGLVVLCSSLHALVLACCLGLYPPKSGMAAAAVVAVTSALMNIAAPAWIEWVPAEFAPEERRGAALGERSSVAGVSTIVSTLASAALLGDGSAAPADLFARCFLLAGLARGVASVFLALTAETPRHSARQASAAGAAGDRVDRSVVASAAWNALAGGVCMPFGPQHATHVAGVGASGWTTITALALCAKSAALVGWGRYTDGVGAAGAITASSLMSAFPPAFIAASSGWASLAASHASGAAAAGGAEVAMIVAAGRSAATSQAVIAAAAVSGAAGAALGSVVARAFASPVAPFVASAALRFLAAPVIWGSVSRKSRKGTE
eukprot:m51a1_g9358 hypothetical protein (1189) ;mRNA; r:148172-152463